MLQTYSYITNLQQYYRLTTLLRTYSYAFYTLTAILQTYIIAFIAFLFIYNNVSQLQQCLRITAMSLNYSNVPELQQWDL